MSLGKVYIHVNSISHYRVPFYNILSDRVDSIHIDFCENNNEKSLADNVSYDKCRLLKISSMFKFPLLNINEVFRSNFIVFEFNPKKLSLFLLSPILILCGKKVYFWGIGARKMGFKSRIMSFLSFFSSGLIVYESQSKSVLEKHFIRTRNISVINNTVSSLKFCRDLKGRNGLNIIFVGTLSKRKGIYQLLDAVVNLKNKIDIKLYVVGDGEEMNNIKDFVLRTKSISYIKIAGRINGINELREFYNKVDLSCSPRQAGLSVLQSFSFGVPFLTHTHAISGGEIENIVDRYTGWLFENNLEEKLLEIASDRKLLDQVSLNCMEHYWNHRTIEMMTDRFCNALLNAN